MSVGEFFVCGSVVFIFCMVNFCSRSNDPRLEPIQKFFVKIYFFTTPLLISIKQYKSKGGKLRNFRKFHLPYTPFVNFVPNKNLQHILFLGLQLKNWQNEPKTKISRDVSPFIWQVDKAFLGQIFIFLSTYFKVWYFKVWKTIQLIYDIRCNTNFLFKQYFIDLGIFWKIWYVLYHL